MKNKIKPYKGGRTSRLPDGRCTPEDLDKLKKILAAKNISYADWVASKIEKEKV